MLWLVTGLSVSALLSAPLSATAALPCKERAPKHAAQKCKSACGVCAASMQRILIEKVCLNVKSFCSDFYAFFCVL